MIVNKEAYYILQDYCTLTVTSTGRKRKADKQKFKIKFKKAEMVFREGQVTNRIL